MAVWLPGSVAVLHQMWRLGLVSSNVSLLECFPAFLGTQRLT